MKALLVFIFSSLLLLSGCSSEQETISNSSIMRAQKYCEQNGGGLKEVSIHWTTTPVFHCKSGLEIDSNNLYLVTLIH